MTAPKISPYLAEAKRAWELSLRDFYNPPLPEPIIEHNNQAVSFFYIDSASWTVHLNTVGVPRGFQSQQVESFLHSICQHEIQHYLVCPYDSVTSGMLFARARRHLDDTTAMFACNLFADLVVDSSLLKRFPRLTRERIQTSISWSASRSKEHSELWKLIVSTYQYMWEFPISSRIRIAAKFKEAAQQIVEVTKKYLNREHRWPTAVEKIARILAELFPVESDIQLFEVVAEPSEDGRDGSPRILIPLDVDAIMGSPVEVRNGDMARRCMDQENQQEFEKELERLAVEIEKRGGTLEELRAIFILAGVGSRGRKWTRFWYRAKVQGLIRFEITERRYTGSVPLAPRVWRLGDPIEELDLVQSLQAFPVLVPNMSTRRWLRSELFGQVESQSPPDLLVVVDSSGSMTWNITRTTLTGEYHLALLAAFASIDFALNRGCKIAAINFSDDFYSSTWSRERREIENVLLSYQGGGTVIPMKKVSELCNQADSPVLTLLITDAEVANWDELVDGIRYLSRRGHFVYLFHITAESQTENMQKHIEHAGGVYVGVQKPEDLVGLVLNEVQPFYAQ